MFCRALAWYLLIAFGALSAGTAGAEPFNPVTYTSPSGEYTLRVVPENPSGALASSTTLRRGGEEVWSARLMYTLHGARVGDDGSVVGFAYHFGHDGWYKGSFSRESPLYIVALDPDGTERWRDSHARSHPRAMSNPPSPMEPVLSGIITLLGVDTVVVRVTPSVDEIGMLETWWRYRLSDGTRLGDVTPDGPADRGRLSWLLSVEAVPKTDLMLVHWCSWDRDEDVDRHTGELALIDHDGVAQWRRALPGEYDRMPERWHPLRARGVRNQAAVEASGFSFASYGEDATIGFRVSEGDDGACVVEEVSRGPLTIPRPGEKVPEAPADELALTPLGTITLDAPKPAGSLGRISSFALDRDGTIAAVSRMDDGSMRLTLMDHEGTEHLRHALPEQERAPEVAPWGDGAWLLYQTGFVDDAARVWRFDGADGSLVELEAFRSNKLSDAIGWRDGGFLGITDAEVSWSNVPMTNQLTAFDRDGRVVWKRELFSPEAVVVTEGGRIAALENIRDRIRFFDDEGEETGAVEIGDAIGQEPNYVTGLEADAGGGLILHDFNAKPPVHRLSPETRATASFTPRHPDGRTFRLVGAVQSARDGTIWACDGRAILRLGEDGTVEDVFGVDPGMVTLDEPGAMALGPDGDLFVMDRRTGRVHVFDRAGRQVRVLTPDPTDFKTPMIKPSLAVAHDGSVYVSSGFAGLRGGGGNVRFGPDGARAGIEPYLLGEVAEEWVMQPNSPRRWALGYTTLALLDEDGAVDARIVKRPNGDWLGGVHQGAVSGEGALALVVSPGGLGSRGNAFVCVYEPDGEPRITIPLPGRGVFSRVAFIEPHVYAVDGLVMTRYDTRGFEPPARATLPGEGEDEPYWLLHAAHGEGELWIRESGSLEIRRYSIPEE